MIALYHLMSIDMRAVYEGHEGEMNEESGYLTFYGTDFRNIFEAMKVLKMLDPKKEYNPWFYRGRRGLIDPEGWILLDERWYPDADVAENIINTKYR